MTSAMYLARILGASSLSMGAVLISLSLEVES